MRRLCLARTPSARFLNGGEGSWIPLRTDRGVAAGAYRSCVAIVGRTAAGGEGKDAAGDARGYRESLRCSRSWVTLPIF